MATVAPALAELTTTAQVIEALGGWQAVAAVVGRWDLTEEAERDRASKAVSNWKNGDTFPANTYVAMTDALRAKGHAAPPALWRQVEAPPISPGQTS